MTYRVKSFQIVFADNKRKEFTAVFTVNLLNYFKSGLFAVFIEIDVKVSFCSH